MKNKLHITLALGLLCFSIASIAQTDTTEAVEEAVMEGKNVRVILTEKKVTKKNAEGNDTTYSKVENVEIKLGNKVNSASDNELEEEAPEDDSPKFIQTKWNKFHLGISNWINADGQVDVDQDYANMSLASNSINVQWDIVTQSMNLYKNKVRLVYGIGVDYNNYKFENNVSLVPDSKPLVVNDDAITYEKNKLVTKHLNVPLLLNFKLSPNNESDYIYLSAGANFGYLIGSHQKQKWNDNGKKSSKTKDDFNLETFRLGYEMQFGYKNIVLYGRYFPQGVFKANQGPNVSSFSAGILLGKV